MTEGHRCCSLVLLSCCHFCYLTLPMTATVHAAIAEHGAGLKAAAAVYAHTACMLDVACCCERLDGRKTCTRAPAWTKTHRARHRTNQRKAHRMFAMDHTLPFKYKYKTYDRVRVRTKRWLYQHELDYINLCRRAAALPRELVEKVLLHLSGPRLRALKYAKGLREVAFALGHRTLRLEDDWESRYILNAFGSVLEELEYAGYHSKVLSNWLLTPTLLPVLRLLELDVSSAETALSLENGPHLVESLGLLPNLVSLMIVDGWQDSPVFERGWGLEVLNTVRRTSALWQAGRFSLFPSLQKLDLQSAGPVLLACLFSEQFPLRQLVKLRLESPRGNIPEEACPRQLTALCIEGHLTNVSWSALHHLVERSRQTLNFLLFGGIDSGASHTNMEVIECPALQFIAVGRFLDYDQRHRDWEQRATDFLASLRSPKLDRLGIGALLENSRVQEVQRLVNICQQMSIRRIISGRRGSTPATIPLRDHPGFKEYDIHDYERRMSNRFSRIR